METAELAFAGAGVPIHQDRRLRKCNYGRLNGMPTSVLEAQRRRRVEKPFPEGESYRQVVGRIEAFLADLVPVYEDRQVLVIGHAATRWAPDHLLTGADLADLVNAPFAWHEGWSYQLRAVGTLSGE